MENGPGIDPSVSTSAEKYTSKTFDLVPSDTTDGDSDSFPQSCSTIVPMLSDNTNNP
jgi:hypothetical protein